MTQKKSASRKAEELRVARYCKPKSQIPLCDLVFSKSATEMSTSTAANSTLIQAAAELLLKNKNLTAKQALLACEATVEVATSRQVHRAVNQIKHRKEGSETKENARKQQQLCRSRKPLENLSLTRSSLNEQLSDLSNISSTITKKATSTTSSAITSKHKAKMLAYKKGGQLSCSSHHTSKQLRAYTIEKQNLDAEKAKAYEWAINQANQTLRKENV